MVNWGWICCFVIKPLAFFVVWLNFNTYTFTDTTLQPNERERGMSSFLKKKQTFSDPNDLKLESVILRFCWLLAELWLHASIVMNILLTIHPSCCHTDHFLQTNQHSYFHQNAGIQGQKPISRFKYFKF